MPESHAFEARLASEWPVPSWSGVGVLVAVSGGPDSLALLRALHRLRNANAGRLLIAHFNHRLRGGDSDADEALVVEVSARLGCPCEVGRASPEEIRSRNGDGLEAAARQARYRFLTKTAERLGARYVAVAHTADDQAETILHRVLRGTGIGGLAGMRRVRPLSPATTLIRPLLAVRRDELRSYLDAIGQPYRVDASNLDPRRTRNRIRHQLLPELAACFNPNIVEALLRLGLLAGEARSVVDSVVARLADRVVCGATPSEICLDLDRLQGEPRYVVRELFMAIWRRQGWPLRDMGLAQWDLLADLAQRTDHRQPGPDHRNTLPGSVLVETGPRGFRLRRLRVDA